MYPKNDVQIKLKRGLITLFLMVMLVPSVFAQFRVGAQIGTNLNQFTMPGTTIGLNAGAFGSYKVASFLTTRLEILYSQEGGGRQNYSLPLSDPRLADISVNVSQLNFINPYVFMHNVQVPILVELTLPEFSDAAVIPKLIIGGSYAYMFGANEIHTTQYIFKDNTFVNIPYLTEDVGSSYVTNQLSIIGGFGLEFNTEKRSFSFDVRYRQGFTQLNNVKQSFSYQDGRLFSSSLSINLSVSLFKF